MKRIILLSILMLWTAISATAQKNSVDEQPYRRSSLYSILVSHTQAQYSKDIEEVFSSIPIPEKFDNHDLPVKIVTTTQKKIKEDAISGFLNKNNVARHVVGRWFNRDQTTGECNMNLIMERGLYDASYYDIELAKMSQRGLSLLSDAGEDLLGNTFVLVNDIRYYDRNKTAKGFAAALQIIGAVASIAMQNSDLADLGKNLGDIVSTIKGFGVTVTSYLYRLDWDDQTAENFYNNYYIAEGDTNAEKLQAFNNSRAFTLSYVGSQSVKSGNISMKGVDTNGLSQMVRKVCTRAIDESIVALQRNYDEFKIKTPIYSVSPTITAKVGLKEGISERSKYEVLEQYSDKNGKTAYRRVGIIQPVKGKIWDNRYMALEEGASGSKLDATTFRKVSGGDFYPGMLIREIKN